MQNKKKNIAPVIIIIGAVVICALFAGGTFLGIKVINEKKEAEQARIEREQEKEEREKRREEREKERGESSGLFAEEVTEMPAEDVADAADVADSAEAVPTPTPLDIPESETSASPQSVDGIIYEADVYESLTLRTQPSTSAEAICLLPAYTQMWIIENTNDTMVKIVTLENNLTGYVNKNYITPQGAVMQRAGKSQPQTSSNMTVCYANVEEFLTLRNAPSTSAEAIDYLPPYTAMYVLEWSGKMAKVVVVETGQTGYVNGDYIITY